MKKKRNAKEENKQMRELLIYTHAKRQTQKKIKNE